MCPLALAPRCCSVLDNGVPWTVTWVLSGHQGITIDRDGCWESDVARAKMAEVDKESSPSTGSPRKPHSLFLQPED